MNPVSKHPSARDSRGSYVLVGILYGALSLPGWIALVTGRLLEGRNPYLLFCFLGTPLALLFLGFGTNRLRGGSRTWTALRIAFLDLCFVLFFLVFLGVVKAGAERFQTAVAFCGMTMSYLAVVTLVFLVRALFQKHDTALQKNDAA